MNPCKEWLSKTEFARVSFSERCVSIKDTTFVYESNHAFESMLTNDVDGDNWKVESCQRLDYSDLEILTLKNELSKMVSLVARVPPGSRKCNTIGPKH